MGGLDVPLGIEALLPQSQPLALLGDSVHEAAALEPSECFGGRREGAPCARDPGVRHHALPDTSLDPFFPPPAVVSFPGNNNNTASTVPL